MQLEWLLLASLLVAPMALSQQAPAPVIFFTDLTNGPATHNSDSTYTTDGGAYVTLYGNFFGTSEGDSTVTLNGASCLHVISWGRTWLWYQKIVVQLSGECSTGDFAVTTPSGTSNGVPFTVAKGKIYYVSTQGRDSNPGTFTKPFATIVHAVEDVAGRSPGNIVYAEDGVAATADDGQDWHGALVMRADWCRGSASQMDSLVAYPGATAQVGPKPGSALQGILSVDFTSSTPCPGYWTFAEMVLRGNIAIAPQDSTVWRIIGNDISNAGNGNSELCAGPSMATNTKWYGNYIHDCNVGDTRRLDQGLYVGTDSNHTEIGWNEIYNTGGRTALQTHSSPLSSSTGFALYDIQIHDNMIHQTREEAMVVDTVDPSKGPVLIYNNVIWNTGQDGSGDALHMQLSGDFHIDHGAGSSPPQVKFYNNTVDCQAGNGCWGSSFPDIHTGFSTTNLVQNNIHYVANPSVSYWAPQNYTGANCSNGDNPNQCQSLSGDEDIVYGNGAATFPNLLAAQINKDPAFVNPGIDFHLLSGSPAIGAAVAVTGLVYDIDGRVRRRPSSIGAYEFSDTRSGDSAVKSASEEPASAHAHQ